MKISEFLDLLENRKLVSRKVVARLREKAAEDPQRLTPKAVLKYLVKKELIDRGAAAELLQTTITVSRAAESSILGTVPPPKVPSARPTNASLVTEEEEIPTLAPIDTPPKKRAEEADNQASETSSIFDNPRSVPPPPSDNVTSLASLSNLTTEESGGEPLLKERHTSYGKSSKKARAKKKGKRERGKSEWDSSLILYGGGGLLVLMLAGGIIYYLLNRENADFVLEQATSSFESGSYTQAIAQYEKFVATFPNHPQHSEAAVRLGTARLWRDSSKTGDPVQALATAQAVLDDIENEPDFRAAQRDLAGLLPKIAQGLATQAEESTDPEVVAERVEQTRQALALCMNTKFVPKEFRDDVLLGEVEETLSRVERSQVRGTALTKALADMTTALSARDVGQAYAIRDALLDDFPALAKDEALAAKVAEVSGIAGEVVEFVSESRPAEQGDRPSPIVAALTLADRRSTGTVGAPGTFAIRVGGAIYGFKAEDGALQWRHYLGVDPHSHPVRLANGDFLVIDARHKELLRLEAATGKTIWRQALEGEAFEPVVAGEVAYVAKPQGVLLIVELESGTITGELRFGQGLAVAPTVDQKAGRLYLLGEHSSLYTLTTADPACLGVYYLGHAAGSIAVPLVRDLNKLIVAVNTGVQSSQLKVLALDRQGLVTEMDVAKRLEGTVDTPLLTEGRRLAAITSLGEIAVFDVANAKGAAALSVVAKREAGKGPSVARFASLKNGNIWLADKQLSKLGVQPTSKSIRLGSLENDFAGDTFNGPLQILGEAVLHVRRPARGTGSIVGAINATSGATVWQTEIAAPLAGSPVVDVDRALITAITSDGAAYALDRDALARRIQDQAVRMPGMRRGTAELGTSVALRGGALAAGALGSDTGLLFHPADESSPLRMIELASDLTAELIAWRDGIIAPTRVGQVFYLSDSDGTATATPFQPPLEAGQDYQWLTPAIVGSGAEARFVISDGKQAIYLVKYVAEPQPHLSAEAQADLAGAPLNTRLAVADDLVAAGADDGTLTLFKLPELESQPAVTTGGQVTWGPFTGPGGFLLATDQDELLFVTSAGEIAWKVPLVGKAPTGNPLVDGDAAYVAWQLNGVSRVNLRDGSLAETIPLDQAVVTGPVAFASRLVVAASDGTLLVINRP